MTASEDLRVAAPGGVAFDLVARVSRRATRSALFGKSEPAVCVGRYELVRPIGSGGMGVVFLATDPELDRTVALKIVHPLLGDADSERTRAEARFTAQVSHPNVVQVFDLGVHDGQLFIAMEYVEGSTLEGWLEPGRSVEAICAVFLDAARGLAAVHASGIVHRDFKPSNVIVGDDERVRIADFGLADLPLRGDRGGTPRFAAPEQIAGAPTDRRADVYAFGQSLHLALSGTFFDGAIASAVPARVADPLRRALTRDVEARAPDLSELIAALEQTVTPRRARWGIAAAIGAAAIAVLAFTLRSNPLYEGVPDDPLPGDAPAVLWIDDNPRYNKDEIAALHDMGLRVVTAVSLEEAQRQGPFAGYVAILSDMERLDESGYDRNGGLRVIRAVREQGADTPVYIYTSERLVPVMTPTVAAAGGNGVTGTPATLLGLVRDATE